MTTATIETPRANGSKPKASEPVENARYYVLSGGGTRQFLVAGKAVRRGATVEVETSSGKVKSVTIGEVLFKMDGVNFGTVARKS